MITHKKRKTKDEPDKDFKLNGHPKISKSDITHTNYLSLILVSTFMFQVFSIPSFISIGSVGWATKFVTALMMTQDPNTRTFKQMLIYINTDTQ